MEKHMKERVAVSESRRCGSRCHQRHKGSRARDDVEVSRLLAGAAKVIARVRYCWLVTEAETGGVCARSMGHLLPNPEKSDWTIRFITDGRSGKVADIRRAAKVGLIFQHDPDDAFVALTGRATLLL